MNICEIEFASSSIAFSVKNINELELSLFSLEFNYSKTTSLELNSLKTNSRKLNFPHTPDFTELKSPRTPGTSSNSRNRPSQNFTYIFSNSSKIRRLDSTSLLSDKIPYKYIPRIIPDKKYIWKSYLHHLAQIIFFVDDRCFLAILRSSSSGHIPAQVFVQSRARNNGILHWAYGLPLLLLAFACSIIFAVITNTHPRYQMICRTSLS